MMKFVLAIFCCFSLFFSSSCKGKNKTAHSNKNKSKKQSVASDTWETKNNNGLDFVAIGYESSWGVEVDGDKTIKFFKKGDRDTLVLPVPVLTKDAYDASWNYKGENPNGMLHVIIREQECSDKVSGTKYYYSAEAKVKRPNEKSISSFYGCGVFLNDYRLNDVFVMTSFKGQELKPEDFPTGVPYIEINLHESKIMGKAGCNSFRGKIKAENNKMMIGPLMTTRMTCEKLALEDEVVGALSGMTVQYNFDKDGLVIQGDQTLLKFKRVEK